MSKDHEATGWDDSAEIQPEGGLTAEDIFGGGDFDDDSLDKFFAQEDKPDEATSDTAAETDGAEEQTPTPESDAEAAEGNGEQDEQTPTPESDPAKPRKLTFRAKIDRKEQDIELDESELPGIYQTAHNYSRLSEKYEKIKEENHRFKALAAQLGYESLDDMIAQSEKADRDSRIERLVSGGTSQEIAEDFVDRKIRNAKDRVRKADKDDDDDAADKPAAPAKADDAADNDAYFRKQVADFFAARPDLRGKLKELPKEVSEAVVLRKGTLREVFADWEAKQAKADAEKSRREKELFAARADAATRAPVRGNPESHTDKGEKPDKFLEAFNADNDWN